MQFLKSKRYCQPEKKKNVPIFIDNDCRLNVTSEKHSEALNLSVLEDKNDKMEVDLGFGQTVRRPCRTAEIIVEVPGFSNPDIDGKTLQMSPSSKAVPEEPLRLRTTTVRSSRVSVNRQLARVNQTREIFNFFYQHWHNGDVYRKEFISMKKRAKDLCKGDVEFV
ncbi:hypothetical protein PsorP6_009244 [Peronosclerospora sorghi]|uniref:Uncharacterized protein n=1 Tax=Peronosclerospora sorghi TaxID=230839 RepID=A0ACC0VZX8_9STRA|nr:hypothetical protein PsorP6_009244 [Peronosclerospora sorghi]